MDDVLQYQVEYTPVAFSNIQVSFKSEAWDYPVADADIKNLKISSFDFGTLTGSAGGAPPPM